MTNSPMPRIARITATLLRILIVLNLLGVILFPAMFAFTFVAEDKIVAAITQEYSADLGAMIISIARWSMIIGLLMVPPVHIVLKYLRDMTLSIGGNHIFTADNVRRLRMIAWALLATQLLDSAFGFISWKANTVAHFMAWGPSLTSWLCVLMLFILSHIFQKGVEMRDDLEGTV